MAGEVDEADSYLNGVFVTFFKRIEDDHQSEELMNLMVTADDNLLIWSEREKQVVVIPSKGAVPALGLKASKAHRVYQKLSCSQPFSFNVLSMKMSFSNQFLAIIGLNGVTVMEMPRQWGSNSLYVGGKANIICRSVLLGENLFRRQINLKVIQMEWYPGSETDSHVILLTNDNCLRCFHVGEYDMPLSTISLSNELNSPKRNLKMNFASALGEEAISFSITPSTVSQNGPPVYPIFVMQENGDVVTYWSQLQQKRVLWKQRGPLKMVPEAEDNYSGNFCSVLCLKTTPTVVVLATKSGIIHHCIVLEDDAEQDSYDQVKDETPQTQRMTLWTMGMTLFVYETIELDFSLIRTTEQQDLNETDAKLEMDVQLCEDASRPHCYFCISTNGVHMVNLTWAEDLKELCFSLKENPEFESTTQSDVNFILCTCPTEKSDPFQILGTSFISDYTVGTLLLCLLENGELVSRPVGYQTKDETEINELTDSKIPRQLPSPLKRLQCPGSFHEYIGKILRRENNLPVIKSTAKNNRLSQAEFYELLTQATNCMREEYIQKMATAKAEIKRRCEILAKHKIQQLRLLNELTEDKVLSENAEILAEKLSTVSENVQKLTERLDDYIHFVQTSSPVLSDSEREWSKEVQQMQNKLRILKRNFEALKQKNENLRLGNIPKKSSKNEEQNLNSSQLIRVKTGLKEQNHRIAELVDKVKTVDKQI